MWGGGGVGAGAEIDLILSFFIHLSSNTAYLVLIFHISSPCMYRCRQERKNINARKSEFVRIIANIHGGSKSKWHCDEPDPPLAIVHKASNFAFFIWYRHASLRVTETDHANYTHVGGENKTFQGMNISRDRLLLMKKKKKTTPAACNWKQQADQQTNKVFSC